MPEPTDARAEAAILDTWLGDLEPIEDARDMAAKATTVQEIVAAARGGRYRYDSEDDLQRGLALAFDEAGIDAVREVRFNERDRPDFLIGDVAVEVKIDGSVEGVLRQLQRYASNEQVVELVLITTKARHQQLPAKAGGKPVTVLYLGGGV